MVVALTCCAAGVVCAQVKAFPSAEGFGAKTIGGRGGTVMEVTNLNDSGTGSFRACAEGTGKRTCVFRVGGTITLTSPINIEEANSYLTIAGQTAPGDGIAIGPWPINIHYGAHDVIVRYIRLRQGYVTAPADGNNDCGNLFVWGGGGTHVYNVIIDHVSGAWACDDAFQGVGYVTDTTFQWLLIGEPYHEGRDGYGGSKGFITGGTSASSANSTISFHHSLIVHSLSRNPLASPIGLLDWRNNIIYNWGACTGNVALGSTDNLIQTSMPLNVNFVGNKYIPGADSNTKDCWFGELMSYAVTKVYTQDNETPWCGDSSCPSNTFDLGWGDAVTGVRPPNEGTYRASTPFNAPAITMTSRSQLESVIANNVGATKPKRDSLDVRFVSEFQSRSGMIGRQGAPFPTLPQSINAPADSDHDGIPDSWELSHGLNANNGADGAVQAANGYTNLENYLNELAGDTVPGVPPSAPPAPRNLSIVNR